MSALKHLTPREASIFACLTDAVVAPEPVLPPVRETDAAFFFDRWLGRSPSLNRAGLRALLYVLELAPVALGYGGRLRALVPERRAALVGDLERRGPALVGQLAKLVKGIAFLSYYGDDQLLRRVGYDPDAVVERGRALRVAEGRP